jgi:hypothetical protein
MKGLTDAALVEIDYHIPFLHSVPFSGNPGPDHILISYITECRGRQGQTGVTGMSFPVISG